MKPDKMTDVLLVGSEGNRGVEFLFDGARYHFWLRGRGMQGVLYKNPPRGIDLNADGYFHTRRLDAAKAPNKALIEHAMMVVERDGLIALAEQAERDAKAEADRQNAEAWRIHKIEKAGPDLLAMLKEIMRWRDSNLLPEVVGRARALIEKLENAE